MSRFRAWRASIRCRMLPIAVDAPPQNLSNSLKNTAIASDEPDWIPPLEQ